MAVRVTQVITEALILDAPKVRVSRAVVEVLFARPTYESPTGTTNSYISSVKVEMIYFPPTPQAKVSNVRVEAIILDSNDLAGKTTGPRTYGFAT